jgi:serine/threonine protein kinase
MRAMARVPLPAAEPMKLTVLAEIASGGMGSVEMARVESGRLAGEVLAIKRLHSSIANDQQFVDMFLDEAWLTAAIKSPHVMGVVAHGTDERGIFLAVELIEGVPLSRLLKEARVKRETFSEQVVACIAMQICEGLTEAHGLKGEGGKPLGLVHRDLTPGNVLVSFDGNVKIVDFGIAKAEERITHTRTGTMKGKPAYMAPEQAKGSKNIDLRADLFSLGVMLFELLASRRPWMEKSAFDVIMAAALKPHPSILEVRPGTSPVFAEIIDRCLAKKPPERWSSAAEIRDRLLAWRRAQSFTQPDLEVLRGFVLRNSQAQIEWFRLARTGEFVKGNAQTFKELEEAIDEARKKSGEMPPSILPPSNALSSGRAAFEAMTPAKAKVSETPPATPRAPAPVAVPAAGAPPRIVTPLAGQGLLPPTMPSLTDASREAQRMGPAPLRTVPLPAVQDPAPARGGGLSATIALSDEDLMMTAGPPTRASEARDVRPPAERTGLGGTAYLEVSPLKGVKLPEPRIEMPDESDLQATIRLPELSERPLHGVESRSVIRPAGALSAPADEIGMGATLRTSTPSVRPAPSIRSAPAEQTRQDDVRGTGWNLRRPAEPPPPAEEKGLSTTTVILLILVAFIAGGGIAAWVAKTYLLKSGALEDGARPVRALVVSGARGSTPS